MGAEEAAGEVMGAVGSVAEATVAAATVAEREVEARAVVARVAEVRAAVVRAAVARAVAKTAAPPTKTKGRAARLDQQVFPDCFSEFFHSVPQPTSPALRTHLHVHRDMHAQKMVTVGWVQPLPRVSIGFST